MVKNGTDIHDINLFICVFEQQAEGGGQHLFLDYNTQNPTIVMAIGFLSLKDSFSEGNMNKCIKWSRLHNIFRLIKIRYI